jgi:hypothetical protein
MAVHGRQENVAHGMLVGTDFLMLDGTVGRADTDVLQADPLYWRHLPVRRPRASMDGRARVTLLTCVMGLGLVLTGPQVATTYISDNWPLRVCADLGCVAARPASWRARVCASLSSTWR